MIKITNLSKSYGPRKVLSNISFDFKEKGIYVIYGPSGSGKTTLLNCVAGLTGFSGSIQVNRQNIEALNDDDLSRLRLTTYGFVFQDFKLFETETVLANLLFPLDTLYSISKAQKIRKCRDLLALVGLPDKEKQNVNKLSGGEKQRVAIARSLINEPIVLLCDEPTGALDDVSGKAVLKLLEDIHNEGKTIVLVTHTKEIAQMANRIITMKNGKVISDEINEHIVKAEEVEW